MKVAELREKAKEFEIETTGKKKAELVEEIYTTAAKAEGFRDIKGILQIRPDSSGIIHAHGYMKSNEDAFVPAYLIRSARLRTGDVIEGSLRPSRGGDKRAGLAKITTVNGMDPEQIRNRPKFGDLTPVYPNEPLRMEHGKDSITGRAIDIVSPIGKGQRGLIVSPPKAGKTTILKKICQSISINNPEVHLICLLVDERPEEVTDMQRSIKGEVVASTFDMPADNHTRVAELVIERAKRIVELGGDVVVVLDSITRLARAYNLAAPASAASFRAASIRRPCIRPSVSWVQPAISKTAARLPSSPPPSSTPAPRWTRSSLRSSRAPATWNSSSTAILPTVASSRPSTPLPPVHATRTCWSTSRCARLCLACVASSPA